MNMLFLWQIQCISMFISIQSRWYLIHFQWIQYMIKSKFWNVIRCYFDESSNSILCIHDKYIEIASNYYQNASNYISKFWLSHVSNVHRKCIEYHRDCIKISIEMHRIISNSLWIKNLFPLMTVIELHRKCIKILTSIFFFDTSSILFRY